MKAVLPNKWITDTAKYAHRCVAITLGILVLLIDSPSITLAASFFLLILGSPLVFLAVYYEPLDGDVVWRRLGWRIVALNSIMCGVLVGSVGVLRPSRWSLDMAVTGVILGFIGSSLVTIVSFYSARTILHHVRRFIEPYECPNCAYDLRGHRHERCPECGHPCERNGDATESS
ncbi:MAG: hypothetical protein HUU22_10390 [Phycisphaerae bacterium]|nr:hypothetical protein [Phycisphaerae bacterium]